jgi:hypothetical protein
MQKRGKKTMQGPQAPAIKKSPNETLDAHLTLFFPSRQMRKIQVLGVDLGYIIYGFITKV